MKKILMFIFKWIIIGLFGLSFLIYSFIKADEADKRAAEAEKVTLKLMDEYQALTAEKDTLNGKVNNLETRLEVALEKLEKCK